MSVWAIEKYVQCRKLQRAQTMTEYVLVLVTIAVVVLVAYQSLGNTISSDVTTLVSDF